ncbi:MAG: hypothetical protein WC819_00310 [Parcubacteria group bacterium]|jgi:hypothetical protein
MKSGHYMAIFIVIVVIVAGAIIFNARTINDIPNDVATIKSQPEQNGKDVVAEQKPINVMKDADIEFDAEDTATDESVDFSDVENVMPEENVAF